MLYKRLRLYCNRAKELKKNIAEWTIYIVFLEGNTVKVKSSSYMSRVGGGLVLGFVDDLAGAIYDIFKFIIRSISYLLAGAIIVAVPMYLIVWIFGLFQ